jgi:hypothetical protein
MGSVTFEPWFKSVVCEETLIGLEEGGGGGGGQQPQPKPQCHRRLQIAQNRRVKLHTWVSGVGPDVGAPS